MRENNDTLFDEALSLPIRERASLVEKLLRSLESELETPEIEAAWKREVLDRCRGYETGQLSERNAADVLNDAYRKVK